MIPSGKSLTSCVIDPLLLSEPPNWISSIGVFTSLVWLLIGVTVGGVVSSTTTPDELLLDGFALPILLSLFCVNILFALNWTLLSTKVFGTNGRSVSELTVIK